jgi:hypothetical protein
MCAHLMQPKLLSRLRLEFLYQQHQGDIQMKRTIALLSLTLALTVMAFGQTARLNSKAPCCKICCPNGCGSCCTDGCGDCCKGK